MYVYLFALFFLSEASYAVQARAVKDYSNMHEPNHIAFKEGDLITVSTSLYVT